MKLKFKYKKLLYKDGGSILLPIIPIELEHKKISLRYAALVDSGADVSVFPWDVADYLSFKKEDAQDTDRIQGVSGDPFNAYLFNLLIVVGGGQRHIERCWFTEELNETQYGFLGQNSFFDNYRIEFYRKKESMTLWRT